MPSPPAPSYWPRPVGWDLVRPALRPGVVAALASLGLLPATEDDREAVCGALVELVTSRLKAG